MAMWDDILTERDRQVFAAAGYGKRQGLGNRPAVMAEERAGIGGTGGGGTEA
jgi:hypothetical protein